MVEPQELEILSGDELGAVLTALEGHTIYPVAFLAAATGARRGELLAMEWRNVISTARSSPSSAASGDESWRSQAKIAETRRGRRSIGISAEAVTMLRSAAGPARAPAGARPGRAAQADLWHARGRADVAQQRDADLVASLRQGACRM